MTIRWPLLPCLVLCLSLALCLSACGGDTVAASQTSDGDDADGGPAAVVDAGASADLPAAADGSGPTEDAAPDVAAVEGAPARVAFPTPGDPLQDVVLTGLVGDGSLSGTAAHVLQCTQAPGGAAFMFGVGAFQSPSTLCVPADVDLADADGSFDAVTPPADAASLTDGYAAVATYYVLQRAHEFFSTRHGWADLDDTPVTALVNVQHHLDACDAWIGVPDGLFLVSGRSPWLGGLALYDGPVISLGQLGDVDMAAWTPVAAHEYGHVIMGGRLSQGAPASFGVSLDGLALAEGLADYFSSAITGHAVHADFGLGPGGALDYAPCGTLVAQPYTYDKRRDLTEPLTCPGDLAGQVHADGQLLSSALWALRGELGEGVDDLVIAVTQGFGASESLEGAAQALIDDSGLYLDEAGAARVAALLTERGLLSCERAVPPEQIGGRGHDMTLTPWLGMTDAFGPAQGAPLQLRLEVPEGAAQVTLAMSVYTPQAKPTAEVLLKKGAPVVFEFQPGAGLTHDASLSVPMAINSVGAATARFGGACLSSGTWYAAIVAREPGLRVRSASLKVADAVSGADSPSVCALPTAIGALGKACPGGLQTVQPAPNEAKHRAAARLTPSSWPFRVESVVYQLSSAPGCSNGVAHSVSVFVGEGQKPAASPTMLATWSVPADAPTPGPRTRRLVLNPPVTLTEGQSLFVAVEMAIQGGQAICVGACSASDTPDAAWWSNAPAAPYPWAELSSFGLDGDLMISALGYAVE